MEIHKKVYVKKLNLDYLKTTYNEYSFVKRKNSKLQ